ncbi:cAMP-dependent protein kinase catalytic subunit gamma-like [Galendromus occidentalis]|uniref:Serine/threonine-protein kinase greatwall n=1 Tax=Galendromus occidentalis TaxID=34638 RepID=A0AAJ6QUY9_9ACAR|nr:cAMP-dependent protein kinase catalytic subunit gamma-like [Galendromus occidentalis]
MGGLMSTTTSFVSKGSWGSVYRVKHLKTGVKCALKIIPKAKYREQLRVLVVHEKKLQFALSGDNIVCLFSAYQDTVNLYLVMEYAKYGHLRRFASRPDGLSENTVRLIAAQLVLGLEYIHACDVLYRDLKESNVLVFGDGYVKIADFGVSRIYRGRANTFSGTPDYMAPEMADTYHGYGLEIDYWALGIVLYRLLYFRHPFRGADKIKARELLHNINTVNLSFPDVGENDELTPTHHFIAGLLERDPLHRIGRHGGDIKQHDYFKGMSFMAIHRKLVRFQVNLPPVPYEATTELDVLPDIDPDKPMNYFDSF